MARDRIYAEFTDRVVKRVDGKQMTYWLNEVTAPHFLETDMILANPTGDGNCQAWSALLRDVLRLQGIEANRVMVWPIHSPVQGGVLVKNWTFTGNGGSGDSEFPYTYLIDAMPGTRIPAQGNSNSPPWFNGHWITESAGAYYDPSYGTAPVAGANKDKTYEDGAFDGCIKLPTQRVRKNNTTSSSPAEVNYILANE